MVVYWIFSCDLMGIHGGLMDMNTGLMDINRLSKRNGY
jgi:hypothetical protein